MFPFPSPMMGGAPPAAGLSFLADIYNWWDPTTGVTSSSGNVSTWADKIASLALPATDAGGGNVTTTTINGASAIQCLGTHGLWVNDTFVHADVTVTFAIVMSFNNSPTSGDGSLVSIGTSSEDWNNHQAFGLWHVSATDDVTLWHNNASLGNIDVGGTYGTPFVAFVEVNTTTLKLYINNALKGTLTDALLAPAGYSDIGIFHNTGTSGANNTGKVGDVMVVNRVLTGTEQTELYNYLKAKYSL